MRNGLVIMTALPPTMGHRHLVDFAIRFLASRGDGGHLEVLLNSRDCEPLSGDDRIAALAAEFPGAGIVFSLCNEDVPQNPSEHPDFWQIWRNLIRRYTGNQPGDLVFASEVYGTPLADALEGEFVPCDMGRQNVRSAATAVRHDAIANFDMLVPAMRRLLSKTVTIFGAESTGKTTMSRALGSLEVLGRSGWVPEWAREYLETVGTEITDERMDHIVSGQFASQVAAYNRAARPFVIQDTDLLSTIGYYKIWGRSVPTRLLNLFEATRSDLYVVMNSRIPFEPDPLRYGGTVRETEDTFWTDLLQLYSCRFYEVQSVDQDEQLVEVSDRLVSLFYETVDMRNFVRT